MELVTARVTSQFISSLADKTNVSVAVVARIVAHVDSVRFDSYKSVSVEELDTITGVGIVNARRFHATMNNE